MQVGTRVGSMRKVRRQSVPGSFRAAAAFTIPADRSSPLRESITTETVRTARASDAKNGLPSEEASTRPLSEFRDRRNAGPGLGRSAGSREPRLGPASVLPLQRLLLMDQQHPLARGTTVFWDGYISPLPKNGYRVLGFHRRDTMPPEHLDEIGEQLFV